MLFIGFAAPVNSEPAVDASGPPPLKVSDNICVFSFVMLLDQGAGWKEGAELIESCRVIPNVPTLVGNLVPENEANIAESFLCCLSSQAITLMKV